MKEYCPRRAVPGLKIGMRGNMLLRRAIVSKLAIWDSAGMWLFRVPKPMRIPPQEIMKWVRQFYQNRTAQEDGDDIVAARVARMFWKDNVLVEEEEG